MRRFFPPKRDFSSLSITDLLEAREAYHSHLAHLENVVATAIGRYRIRETDPDAEDATNRKAWRNRKQSPPRTLQNTVVKPWSWPCLLVFVEEWLTQEEIVKENPDQVVPRFLYMPNGRVVPTCVIYAQKQESGPPPLNNLNFPCELIGGGYPVLTDVQGQLHVGSLGCMVTDGDRVYALTNRHVTGEEGRPVFSLFQAERQQVGRSNKNQIGKKLFKDVYPGWPGERSYANLDAGLIEVDDVTRWTAQVFGVGELDDPVDLNTDTISLDLIGCPVRAFGGASGELVGEIQALFYRYKSIGGFDYVGDLLIGPRSADMPLKTIPGDSGTCWVFDPDMTREKAEAEGMVGKRARRFRPIALQWGGHALLDRDGESQLQFALATCLSTICRELDVDVVPDWNIGHSEYWGKTGHYKIAAKACELVSDAKLKKLLLNNLSNIAFDDEAIRQGELKKINAKEFSPLADVPDLIWRSTRKKDEANHFADMDEPGKGEFKGKTLLDLCKDPDNLSIEVWNRFYDSLSVGFKRGALPFRVWQIYQDMVQFVRNGEVTEFICAGGILSHYVGDACQPLHVSSLHHGRPGHPEEERVHSVYETDMLDRFAPDIIAGVNQKLARVKAKADVNGGKQAALSVVELMRGTIKKLPPLDVIESFNEHSDTSRIQNMFNDLGKRTTSCMADGCLRLASLWASAWKEGGGSKIAASKLAAVDREELKALYADKKNVDKFLPAFRLQDPKFAETLDRPEE